MQTRFVVAALAAASFVTAAAAAATAAAQTAPTRPKITSISHMAVYTSDAAAAEHFYTVVVGAAKLPDPENPRGVRYALNATQFIEVLPLPADAGIRRMDHTAWNTESAEGMRKYLAAKGWKVPAHVERGADGSRWFEVLDPEGNKVQFVEPPAHPKPVNAPNVIGDQIIHFGIRVQSRAAEDAFYRGLLGFKPYWWGGMKEGEVNWVAQQCPDGHQWLEYMIESKPDNGDSGHHDAEIPWRRGPLVDRRGLGSGCVSGARERQPAGGDTRYGAKDRRGREVPVQPLRSRRHAHRADGLPRDRETELVAVYGGGPVGVRENSGVSGVSGVGVRCAHVASWRVRGVGGVQFAPWVGLREPSLRG